MFVGWCKWFRMCGCSITSPCSVWWYWAGIFGGKPTPESLEGGVNSDRGTFNTTWPTQHFCTARSLYACIRGVVATNCPPISPIPQAACIVSQWRYLLCRSVLELLLTGAACDSIDFFQDQRQKSDRDWNGIVAFCQFSGNKVAVYTK